MALNFLVSSSMNVGGRWIGAPEQAQFCTFNGFMTQVFVIQTDYWVLIVAVCTYFVLADHKRSSSWVQTRLPVLWTLPWLFSITWAAIGLGVTGYGDVGAWCWFTSDQVRLLVSISLILSVLTQALTGIPQVNFVPRCRYFNFHPAVTETGLDTPHRDHHRGHVHHVREAVLPSIPRSPPHGPTGRFGQPQRFRLSPPRNRRR